MLMSFLVVVLCSVRECLCFAELYLLSCVLAACPLAHSCLARVVQLSKITAFLISEPAFVVRGPEKFATSRLSPHPHLRSFSLASLSASQEQRCSVWRCPDQTMARFVRVQLQGFNFLHVAQVGQTSIECWQCQRI